MYTFTDLQQFVEVARTTEEREAIKAQAITNARMSPHELAPLLYTTDTGDPLIPTVFHREWLNYLLDTSIDRLVLLAARGHSKSEMISAVYVCWYLGTHPESRILLVTENDDLATRYCRYLLEKIRSPIFQSIFPFFPSITKATEHEIFLQNNGRDPALKVAGAEVGITGLRSDLIILDDVVTSDHVASPLKRQRLLDWFRLTLDPILVPDGRLIIVGTPYHELDLYTELESVGYRVVKYPAVQPDGTLLWPERFTAAFLESKRRELGLAAFSSQYLVQPITPSGEIVKREWFSIIETCPPLVETWWAWDTALSEKTTADETAGVYGGKTADGDIIICNLTHAHIAPDKVQQTILQSALSQVAHGVLLEDTKEARVWKAWMQQTPHAPPIILASHGGISKYARLAAVLPVIEAGRVKLLRGSWNNDFITQVCSFTPDGRHAHDDITDAMVYLLARLLNIIFSQKRSTVTAPILPSRSIGPSWPYRRV